MVKKALLLFTAAACFTNGAVKAQQQAHCFTDEMHARAKAKYPAVVTAGEAQLKAEIDAYINKMNLPKLKVTAGDDDTAWKDKRVLHIPVVFHIIHNYGTQEYISDNLIYDQLEEINRLYRGENADTNDIIATYKGNIPGTSIRYRANTHIQFHLATKDPLGNPTTGITRRRDHSTTSAGDHSKFDLWPPQSYLNIWIVNAFDASHAGAAAYALKPSSGAALPWFDGPITFMQAALNYDNTLAHEIGHFLDLDHPWGGTNAPEVACGDDAVDDTPPTDGHDPDGMCSDLEDIWDTKCVLTSANIGKISLNTATKTTDNATGLGIKFKTLEKCYIDQVSFYPADSGKTYTIVLKHKNPTTGQYTSVGTYSLISADNKTTATIGLTGVGFNADTTDSQNGVGITFRTLDTVFIRNVKFHTPTASLNNPYTIVLKRNGSVIDTHSGIVDDTIKVANLNFGVPFAGKNAVYSLEFAVNPGSYRQKGGTSVINNSIANVMSFISDTAQGRYNYFYNWNVYAFNYKQAANVAFVAPIDTNKDAYSLEFSVNPGAHRDSGSSLSNIGNIMYFTDDTTNNQYDYFYSWAIRHGDYFIQYSPVAAKNLFNIPPSGLASGPVTIDYPDTVNSQNVMDYTYCSKMFTYLQGVRMRAALRSNVAFRNNLIDTANLIQTGVMNTNGTFAARPDMAPVADYSTRMGSSNNHWGFTCRGSLGQTITFVNQSWRDTVSKLTWTFSNGATNKTIVSNNPTINSTVVSNKFDSTGWVTVELIAESNAGKDTLVSSNKVFIADENSVPAANYFQEFNPGTDLDQYPIFNHFNNFTKWEVVNNAGYYDNTSIRYKQFDTRNSAPAVFNGTPRGDYDDFYTRAFNLKNMGNTLYLTFYTAGAFRTNNSLYMTDELEVAYSINCGNTWRTLKTLRKSDIGNNSVEPNDWTPAGFWQWQGQNVAISATEIPEGVRERVFFRFRYKPGVDPTTLVGSGNNFYLDRIHVSSWTTDVNDLAGKSAGFTLAPNPTTGSTTVIIKDAQSNVAQITVTDVTGKLVYSTQANLNSSISRVEIPANYISVKGMYLVSVVTGTQKQTEKLVVY